MSASVWKIAVNENDGDNGEETVWVSGIWEGTKFSRTAQSIKYFARQPTREQRSHGYAEGPSIRQSRKAGGLGTSFIVAVR